MGWCPYCCRFFQIGADPPRFFRGPVSTFGPAQDVIDMLCPDHAHLDRSGQEPE